MDTSPTMQEEQFFSLGEAARTLGVHPSTIRAWSDQGRIPVYRTQGGHRRYRVSEIRLWRQSLEQDGEASVERALRLVMASVRKLVEESQLQAEPWYRELDLAAREMCRTSGLALTDGLAWRLTSGSAGEEETAESVGWAFAGRCRQWGMSRIAACQAMLYFRGALLDALLATCDDDHAIPACTWAEMLRQTADFTDQALLAIIRRYEEVE